MWTSFTATAAIHHHAAGPRPSAQSLPPESHRRRLRLPAVLAAGSAVRAGGPHTPALVPVAALGGGAGGRARGDADDGGDVVGGQRRVTRRGDDVIDVRDDTGVKRRRGYDDMGLVLSEEVNERYRQPRELMTLPAQRGGTDVEAMPLAVQGDIVTSRGRYG